MSGAASNKVSERFHTLLMWPTGRVIFPFRSYLWNTLCGPGLGLSLRLSESSVKTTDKSFLLGYFPRPAVVKAVFATLVGAVLEA